MSEKYCKICGISEISNDINPAEVESSVCSLCQKDLTIKDLQAENDRLVEALRSIADMNKSMDCDCNVCKQFSLTSNCAVFIAIQALRKG